MKKLPGKLKPRKCRCGNDVKKGSYKCTGCKPKLKRFIH